MINIRDVKENDLERTLRIRLEEYGFEVLKLRTPGYSGTMDRLILRPRYSPGAPMFLELKKDAKLRALQEHVANDWATRGCIVLPFCKSLGEIDQLCSKLIKLVFNDYERTGGY
jgi:hypothetical protein